jgi:hypothetical protein
MTATLRADHQPCQNKPGLLIGPRSRGRTTKTRTKFPDLSAKEAPTQGHHRDMGTTPNTAAIYVRRYAFNMKRSPDPA